MTKRRILVTGATGKTGRRLVSLLRARGQVVREASRSSLAHFDWADQGSWAPALEGVSAAYVVTPSAGDRADAERFRVFGQLAVAAGVTTAVLVSIPNDGSSYFGGVQEAEKQLRDTGLKLTILRPRWFNQNFSEDFLTPSVVAGDLRLPAGDGKEAFVDANDIAEVAAAALTDPSLAGQDYELTGPRLLGFAEIAAELTKALGRPIRYTPLSKEDFIAEQLAFGVPEDWAHLSADLYAGIASGGLETTTTDIQHVLRRPPLDFRAYAATTASSGAWNSEDAAPAK